VLAGAVHGERGGRGAGGDPGQLLDVVDRVVRRSPQGGLVQAGGGQHPAYAVEVEGLAGVAGRGQREQLAVEGEPGLEHPHGLHRLVGRAREDRRVGGAELEDPAAVRGEGQQAAAVVALDEAGPDDLGEQSVCAQRSARRSSTLAAPLL
jgi:hypothetical protein